MGTLVKLGRRELLRLVAAVTGAAVGGAALAQQQAVAQDSFGFIETDGGNLGNTVEVDEL